MTERALSRFGSDISWPEPLYDNYERRSAYAPVRDGTRLAYDLFLPVSGDHPSGLKAHPVIFSMTPYNRASIQEGQVKHALADLVSPEGQHFTNPLRELVRHGFAVLILDVRGQGASFGHYMGCMSAEEARDGADIIAWMCEQPWCDGNVGMMGSSYGASTQFLVATERPESLKAMFAAHTYFDAHDVFFPNGAREISLPREWGALVDALSGRTEPSIAAPVDGPDGLAMLGKAVAEHKEGPFAETIFARIYESSVRDGNGFFDTLTCSGAQNLCLLLPQLQDCAPPAYFWGGWNDYFPDQMLKWHVNWTAAPSKLALGPWTHSPFTLTSTRDEEDLRLRATEGIRWFGHWLKGYDTGILDDPPIHYAVQDSHPFVADKTADEDTWAWQATQIWPPEGVSDIRLFLNDNPSPLGMLQEQAPQPETLTIPSTPKASTGPQNRMGSSFKFLPVKYPCMADLAGACLTFKTEAFKGETVLLGAPQVSLTLSTEQADQPLFFWLLQVPGTGPWTLLTYAAANLGHIREADAPYSQVQMVYHDSRAHALVDALKEDQLRVSLLPVASRLGSGSRLALMISTHDANNFAGPNKGAPIKLHLRQGTFLDLPLEKGD